MNKLYHLLINSLNSRLSVVFVISYCLTSFYWGQSSKDMNLFAASGGVMTVFGLFSMIQFTTIEKYLNQEAIVAASTGMTGPPVGPEEAEKIRKKNQEIAKVKLKKELRSELRGISFTIIGTLVWAYGIYIPIFQLF